MTLLVLGHTNLDILLDLEKPVIAGGSSPVHSKRTVYGGTACNIAKHAATLNCDVRLWSRVGGDFPKEWRDRLERCGVDLRHLVVEPDGRTPTCYILSHGGEQSFCMDQGAMAHMSHEDFTDAMLDGVHVLHVATGQPQAYLDIMAAAKQRGIQVHFDPGQEIRFAYDPQTLRGCLQLADVVWLNQFEANHVQELLGLQELKSAMQPGQVWITTLGAKGVQLQKLGEAELVLPAKEVQVLDATGAGDALRAATHAAMAFGLDPLASIKKGMRAAALVVQSAGPQELDLRWDLIDPMDPEDH